MLSTNELAGIGMGLAVGAGGALVNDVFGLGIGVIGIGALLIAIKRDRGGESDGDE